MATLKLLLILLSSCQPKYTIHQTEKATIITKGKLIIIYDTTNHSPHIIDSLYKL